MKILYGVVGEGMGHAIRSSVILNKLLRDGHDVHIVVSGRAYEFLKKQFPQVSKIWGLTMVMEHNELQNRRTALKNISEALEGWPANIKQYFEVEAAFEPDVVISDFESWSWMFAKWKGLPLICIDNIQIINRCKHSSEIIGPHYADFRLVRSVVKAKAPGADHYMITTFFYPKVRKPRTTLVPPILRDNILQATPTDGDHLLVYQTSETFASLPETLRKLDRPVRIYGLRRDLTEEVQDGNLTWCPFSETKFVDDLASCAGVIASAGFTLMGEAIHLGKPYLATPVKRQFEQTLNALYLEELGYGMNRPEPNKQDLRDFIAALPRYKAALATYDRPDNTRTFEVLDGLLDQAAAGVLRDHSLLGDLIDRVTDRDDEA
jgi:uncharacterized protein (TIGR00661 family)